MSTSTVLTRPCNWGDEAGVLAANEATSLAILAVVIQVQVQVCVCVCVCVCVFVCVIKMAPLSHMSQKKTP